MGRRALVLRDSDLDLHTPEGRARLGELKVMVIRMRNWGATMDQIADKVGFSLRDTETLLQMSVQDIMRDDVETLVARNQSIVDDITRAMYPALQKGDTQAAVTVIRAQEHAAKLRGLHAPQRIRIGLDPEEFATTVAGDLQALGVSLTEDTPVEPDDDGWADV